MNPRVCFVGLSVLAAVFACGCASGRDKPDGSGSVEATEVRVSAEVAGRLISVYAQEGAAVTAGQVVAEIDDSLYRLRCSEAEAAEKLAAAQLDLVTAGSRGEDIQRARALLKEAEAAAWAAGQNWKRVQDVFAQQGVSAGQADEAKAAAERTEAARAAAEETVKRLTAGSREQEIRVARAALDAASARLAMANRALRDVAVRAPVDGTVTLKSAEAGEVVAVGTPLVTIARLNEVWISVYLPERAIASLKLGQAARVRVDGYDRDLHGVVTFVSPEAEFSPKNVQTADERAKLVYRVKVALPNSGGILKPGMPADAWME
jgi:HlyD family secretion protein